MADQNAFFITGANCRIRIGTKLVAMATNVSCRVIVNHATPRLLGQYEVADIQPVSYDVTGSLTIIRYVRGLKEAMEAEGKDTPLLPPEGNSIGSANENSGSLDALSLQNILNPDIAGSFNPSTFFRSEKFDIELLQTTGLNERVVDRNIFSVPEAEDRTPFARLQNCRFTAMELNITKRGVAQQSYQFTAQYYHDDTFLARKSGIGQDLS